MHQSATFVWRVIQRLHGCHANSDSPIVSASADRRSFQPLRQCPGLIVDLDAVVRSHVAILHLVGRPATVFRRVVARVVDAIERVFVAWAPTHVGEERFVGLPVRAHRDASPAVASVQSMIWILAPRLHVRPAAIFRCLTAIRSFAMSAARFAARYTHLTSKAPAAFGFPAHEHVCGDKNFLTASAPAQPDHLATLAFCGLFFHQQVSKTLIFQA